MARKRKNRIRKIQVKIIRSSRKTASFLYNRRYIVYHREGIMGDYDEFEDIEELIKYIQTGKR